METLFDRAAKISRTQVTKMRWVLGLHGLASVVFGVMILAWPASASTRSRSCSAPTRSRRASSSSALRSPRRGRRSACG